MLLLDSALADLVLGLLTLIADAQGAVIDLLNRAALQRLDRDGLVGNRDAQLRCIARRHLVLLKERRSERIWLRRRQDRYHRDAKGESRRPELRLLHRVVRSLDFIGPVALFALLTMTTTGGIARPLF